jgi:hypothetical protein
MLLGLNWYYFMCLTKVINEVVNLRKPWARIRLESVALQLYRK